MFKLTKTLGVLPAVFHFERPTLKQIRDFVDDLKSDDGNLGKDPFPLVRELKDGFYTRTVVIPAGHLLAGAIHRADSFVMMKSGKLIVAAEGESKVLTGPCMFMSAKGKQKIGYAVEDTVWVDIHQTDAKTCEEADAELFTEDYAVIDRDDFQAVLIEMDITETEVRRQCENKMDIIEMPKEFMYRVSKDSSVIQGRGIFSCCEYNAGDVIVPARFGHFRTFAGRYTNHSPNPNVEGKLIDEGIYLVAINNIAIGEELTVDYRRARNVALKADKQLSEE